MKRALVAVMAGVMVVGASGIALGQAAGHDAPAVKVYDESADARKQIADALAAAKKDDKRVLIQWGGNWCPWCLRLNVQMHSDGEIAGALSAHYVLIHVDCGRPNGKNLDLAESYGAAAGMRAYGFPYLTILDADGKVVVNQESRGLNGMEPGTDKPEEERLKSGHEGAKVLKFLLDNRAPVKAKPAPVYDEAADAKKQIADALASAKSGGKRVLIQWGGNWCPWCIRLHELMTSDEKIAAALKVGYVVVHVDAGRKDKNVDLAHQYKADVDKGGYPYLTVLDSDGKVIANQETAALEVKDAKGESVSVKAGHDPVKVLKFLEANRAPAAGAGAAGGGK